MNSIDIIPFAEGEARLDWLGLTDAMATGHLLPKAEIADTFLYRDPDTLLNRAAWIDGLGLAVKSATVFPGNSGSEASTINGGVTLYSDATGAWLIPSLGAGSSSTLEVVARVAPDGSDPTGTGAFRATFANDDLPSTLAAPSDLHFDALGNLYVTSFSSNQVLRFDDLGRFDTVFASGNGLRQPSALAVGPDGDVSGQTLLRQPKHQAATPTKYQCS